MAEAFSIAGSAFGTVSLGLQLFKEISQYLDDIDGREEDLKQARTYANNVQLTINALHVAVSNAPTNDPNAKSAMDSCAAACVATVNDLLAVIKELRGPAPVPNSHVARAKDLRAKLKYPFKKQNVEKLEKRLSRTYSALQNALHVLQLKTGNATNKAIFSMQQTVTDANVISARNQTALDKMEETSRLHDDRLSSVQQDVRELLILTRGSSGLNHSTGIMSLQSLNIPSDLTYSTSLRHDQGSGASATSIRTTSYQGGGSMTYDGFCSCKTQRTQYSRNLWGPFLVEAEIRSRDHHAPECPMSKLPAATRQTKRILNFSIPTLQNYWRSASKVTLSCTTGAGILGIGQTVTWIATVSMKVSPVFRLVRSVTHYVHLQHTDMRILLDSCFRRLVCLFTKHYGSAMDVNERGHSVLEWALRRYQRIRQDPSEAGNLTADNIASLFQMLFVLPRSATYTSKSKSEPISAQLARSRWFLNCTRPDQVTTALLSRYIESVGHHHHEVGYWYLRQQRQVFEMFPQLAGNLEFGPLSQAILKEDQIGVRQLLERYPSCVSEISYCGQTPVHLAIRTRNTAILSIVLHYADAEILNAKDNNGDFPIDYAIRVLSRSPEAVEESARVCKMLELLLRSESALFPSSIRFAYDNPHIEAMKILIMGLYTRRQKLKELAYRILSPAEIKDLKIQQARILDQNAALVQHHLEAQGCCIPMYLKVYEDGAPSKNSESIYSLISNGQVAEYAYQQGFYFSDNEFADLICKLATYLGDNTPWSQELFSCSYFSWLVGQGTSVESKIPTDQGRNYEIRLTPAHYLMAVLGTHNQDLELTLDCPLSPAAFEIAFSQANVDDCHCWCSPWGCSPLVKLLESIYRFVDVWVLRYKNELSHRLARTTGLFVTGLFSGQMGRIGEYQWIYGAIIRYFTFSLLGLRHVCCRIVGESLDPGLEEECREIQEEDSFLLAYFERLIMEFEDKIHHDMTLEVFFRWMRMDWSPRIQEAKQDLAAQRLTDEELRDAESIGVVWEVYGPQPMEERCDVAKWGVGDLWDAMDELDQIATDPERPIRKV
ncbi:hypothetical protein AU210_014936 [Fusarium oxysporum f. sp. radicis-cucumerinum]|uniref:Fungal N-terminal domain-containing protein n=1 Tax=Fusarium oxysporum f. sp. radicis-cucumerinum TaxID=327505 RepID=A0A2H3G8M1_FUSOX|nr:hypothetical protein AU210_014936 [Fusarium oxysporum f. sp. radicis-cucumerinum]